MSRFDMMMLLKPDDKELREKAIETVKSLILDAGGRISKDEDWGEHKLFFEICGFTIARYHLFKFYMDSVAVDKFQEELRECEDILRFVIIERCRKERVKYEKSTD